MKTKNIFEGKIILEKDTEICSDGRKIRSEYYLYECRGVNENVYYIAETITSVDCDICALGKDRKEAVRIFGLIHKAGVLPSTLAETVFECMRECIC